MAKLNLSKRVDYTYLIGAFISLNLVFLTLILNKKSNVPMMISQVCLGTYIGVIIRGMIDPSSWGKTQKQIKLSAFVGFTSIFVIVFIVLLLLLTLSFDLSRVIVNDFLIYGGMGMIVLYTLFYLFWFRKVYAFR